MARYRLSGFTLHSNVALPELPSSPGEPTHVFRLDAAARPWPRPRWYHHWQEAGGRPSLSFARTASGYLLRFPALADFEVTRDGARIRARQRRAVPPETLRHLLLDQVWPLALSGGGHFVIHASAVVLPDGRAIAFAGAAGVGKSSLAARLASEGCRVLCDDCLLIEKTGAEWRAVPGYPGLRLWPDMLAQVHARGDVVTDVAHYTSKKRLDRRALPFARDPAPLTAVYLIHALPGSADVRLAPLPGARALMELVPLTYLLDHEDREQLERSFAHLAALTSAIPTWRLELPHAAHDVSALLGAMR